MATTAADIVHEELTGDLLKLCHLVESSEIIAAKSPEYINNTEPWSSVKDKHPRLVLRPKTLNSLSQVVKFLSTTTLEYKVRSGGYGSSSATDVLISLSSFDDFESNEDEKYVILGAGGSWRSYYQRMEKVAPNWMVVAARTPALGIGGSTLCAGYSWLSSEHGLISDPSNLLDIRVVTATGEVKWASSDPDLSWAMRGTEGGFAIATHFKFRAHHFPENGEIWSGPIMIPIDKAAEAAEGIMGMVEMDKRGDLSVKTSIVACVLQKGMLGTKTDMLVVQAYDARGKEQGREAFRWALEIDGAIDQTKGSQTLLEIEEQCRRCPSWQIRDQLVTLVATNSNTNSTVLTSSFILNAISWWSSMQSNPDSSIAQNAWLLFELFTCRDNLSGRHSSVWPRPEGFKHIVLLDTGCAKDSSQEVRDRAKEYILEGPRKMLGKELTEIDTVPAGLDTYHNIERIYGEHYEKLRQIKTQVDPENRLQGWIKPYKERDVSGSAVNGVNGHA